MYLFATSANDFHCFKLLKEEKLKTVNSRESNYYNKYFKGVLKSGFNYI